MSVEAWAWRTAVSEVRAHVRVEDVETAASERRAHVLVGVLVKPHQVMSLLLLKALVQVFVFVLLMKALLKVAGLFSLLSPLTQTQTTMPQTRPCGA